MYNSNECIEMFYLDINSLLETGKTITGATYTVSGEGVCVRDTAYRMTDTDRALAKTIVGGNDIKDNFGWQLAKNQIAGTNINLCIAMQQLIEEDAWLTAPLTEDEKTLFAVPDGDDFVVWE